MTRFQQVLIEVLCEPMDVSSIEAVARTVEDRLNRRGLKVVEAVDD